MSLEKTMRYRKFPTIETIDDVLPAVAGRDEFVVAERPWGTVIDYIVVLPDTFPCPVQETHNLEDHTWATMRRECRGIKFYPDGTLAARPYHKFFNLDERQETTSVELGEKGRFHEKFVIMPKLDGSMIHPIMYDGTVHFCTRMGITDVAQPAKDFAVGDLSGDHATKSWYEDFCHDLLRRGITPIFEWCSRKQRIVIDYPQDQLILTAIRVNKTGEYLTRGKMRALADPYNIPMADLYTGDWNGIDKFAETVRDITEEEGFVIRWDDGNMVKMKGDWYLELHRAKDAISFEKRVIGLILNDEVDDILPSLLPMDYNRMIAYRKDFWAAIKKTGDRVERIVENNREKTIGLDQKDAKKHFALHVVPSLTTGKMSLLRGLLFSVWDGEKPLDALVSALRRKFSLDVDTAKDNGSLTDVQDLRDAEIIGAKSWLDYDGTE
jgi:RNA ligase